MNTTIGLSLLMGICAVLLLALPAGADVSYGGGDGSSMDKAIVVNAPNEDEGVGAEYDWLAAKFGPRNVVWKMDLQSTADNAGKMYDILEVEFLKDAGSYKAGDKVSFFFDITPFYGKF
jgi:hypothetical protein